MTTLKIIGGERQAPGVTEWTFQLHSDGKGQQRTFTVCTTPGNVNAWVLAQGWVRETYSLTDCVWVPMNSGHRRLSWYAKAN